jgi:hypothetical protein
MRGRGGKDRSRGCGGLSPGFDASDGGLGVASSPLTPCPHEEKSWSVSSLSKTSGRSTPWYMNKLHRAIVRGTRPFKRY